MFIVKHNYLCTLEQHLFRIMKNSYHDISLKTILIFRYLKLANSFSRSTIITILYLTVSFLVQNAIFKLVMANKFIFT